MLGLGLLLLVVVKSTLIACVVRAYGPPWRTAWTVGVTMVGHHSGVGAGRCGGRVLNGAQCRAGLLVDGYLNCCC